MYIKQTKQNVSKQFKHLAFGQCY